MVGTSEVCSIDQCCGWLFSSQSAAGRDTFGSGLRTSRYRRATSGATIVASLRKYEPVVSFTRSGGTHSATLVTAAESCVTALPRDGTEPCPAGPRAMSSIARGSFSVVPTLAWRTTPPERARPPPSARQYSAAMASKWSSIMNCAPTSGAPSSPDSASRMTSRSSAALLRCNDEDHMRPAVRLSLSSTVPRP